MTTEVCREHGLRIDDLTPCPICEAESRDEEMNGIIAEKCNDKQLAILSEIHQKIQGFYEGHDNTTVYALTGLISNLTDIHHNDPRYVREQVNLIFGRPDEE